MQRVSLRLLLACGVLGPLVFIAVFLVEGAVRPDYDPWRHVVSSLSRGDRGWIQITNFVVSGALVLAFAAGLRRALHPGRGEMWAPILLAVFGLCLVGAGVFVADPFLGYPPGADSAATVPGALHVFVSFVAFAALPAACFVLARRFAGERGGRVWAVYSVAAGVLVLVFLIISDAMASAGPDAPAGLFQRLSIITGWTWIAAIALRLMFTQAPAGQR
jgi:hypothetical membrane protein